MDFANRLWHLFQQNGHDVREPNIPPDESPSTALEEKQSLLAHHVRLAARRMTNGLFCYGSRGGLGKTRVILKTLATEHVRPLVLNGHITPLSLYANLFANPNSVVVLDDCDSLYRNLAALGILRSALWGEANQSRLVTYNSSQLKLPSSFEFSGSLILTANTLPRSNHAFDAVLSRIDVFELDASNEEVVELMRHLAKHGFEESLSEADCLQVVDFIAEFASTRELSLRLLEPSFRKVLYAREAGVAWKDLVRSQLEQIGVKDDLTKPQSSKAYALACLQQVVEEYPDSVGQQVDAWCELTGRSRATFFRLKKAMGKREGGEAPNDGQSPSNN